MLSVAQKAENFNIKWGYTQTHTNAQICPFKLPAIFLACRRNLKNRNKESYLGSINPIASDEVQVLLL